MITVGELIEELKKLPQDIPVAAWDSSESVDFITSGSLILCPDNNTYRLHGWNKENGEDVPGPVYEGPILVIDEFDAANLKKER